MTVDGIAKDGLSNSKDEPCGVSSLSVRVSSVCEYNVVSGCSVDVLE